MVLGIQEVRGKREGVSMLRARAIVRGPQVFSICLLGTVGRTTEGKEVWSVISLSRR